MIAGLGRLADLLSAAERPVVFTGAGVSTESGIPDFRSPGGVWARFDVSELDYPRFMASADTRRRYWQLGRELYPVIRGAHPNAAHRAIARLWDIGRLDCCLTQNIDDLHQRAGLPAERVIELHGNATRARCLDCRALYPRDEVHRWLAAAPDGIPGCPACGGTIKPTTVLFGEPMPRAALAEAERRARACDLFVVVGSSLAVYPAAYMPRHARHAGARLAILNLTPTPYDHEADVVIRGHAGAVLAALVEEVTARV
ncbi:MAG: NAD-dependent deacylase [Candidatus Rokubacteria bacterium]|nr:NAD-dependent deacylase [Candidatus Rokubacteria bacterium]